jgi:hypothetical protein
MLGGNPLPSIINISKLWNKRNGPKRKKMYILSEYRSNGLRNCIGN